MVKARAYIVSLDKKTTVYKLEDCEIAFFETRALAVHSNALPYFHIGLIYKLYDIIPQIYVSLHNCQLYKYTMLYLKYAYVCITVSYTNIRCYTSNILYLHNCQLHKYTLYLKYIYYICITVITAVSYICMSIKYICIIYTIILQIYMYLC